MQKTEIARQARQAARLYAHLAGLPRLIHTSGLPPVKESQTRLYFEFSGGSYSLMVMASELAIDEFSQRMRPRYKLEDAQDLGSASPLWLWEPFQSNWAVSKLWHDQNGQKRSYSVYPNSHRDCQFWYTPYSIQAERLWHPDREFMREVIRLNLLGHYD